MIIAVQTPPSFRLGGLPSAERGGARLELQLSESRLEAILGNKTLMRASASTLP